VAVCAIDPLNQTYCDEHVNSGHKTKMETKEQGVLLLLLSDRAVALKPPTIDKEDLRFLRELSFFLRKSK
jgi:hypothetical protein